ncbi:hypothetical protein ACFY93_10785 [Streptomyces sp. NPDC008313]|uniref:hypothetical protein n=1 Tax=Streptomyces sp. NPDC008313 TaxID=3364826 RepID=UPI0036EB7CD7
MVRPADMLVADIGLVNLRFDGRRLVRRDPGAPTLVLVGLPPQHVLEEIPPPLGTVATALGPMQAATAGSTQLAFSVPADIDGLELSLTSMLNWARLVPMTVPTGLRSPDTAGSTVFQGIPRSVIEYPTRLLITYDEPVDWVGRLEPQLVDGRTALWHTRLQGPRDDEVLLRAFATVTDGSGPTANNPLTAEKLEDIVTLTSRAELSGPGGPPIEVPSAPLRAEQFIITPLGTSAHLHGAWEKLSQTAEDRFKDLGKRVPNLAVYDHITGLGRDQYVRAVSRGRLSTGHAALHVAEVRRQFVARPNDGIVAYLQREDRIVVKEPEVRYGPETRFTHGGREMPFRALRITDRVTPPLLQPVPDNDPFWVVLQSSAADHEFTLIGTDHENRTVSFTMPLVFVPDGMEEAEQETRLRQLYASDEKLMGRVKRSMGGQVMAMAQPPAGAPGSTSHAVGTLTFGLGTTGPAGRPVVGVPHVSAAEVRVPAVEQFAPRTGYLAVTFNDTFLQQSMEKHPAGAYLSLDQAVSLTFGAEKAGGVASPNASVKLITSQAGVVPDVFRTGAGGEVVDALPLDDIKRAFGGAKLLGFIDLSRYLQGIAKDSLGTLRQLGDDQIEAVLRAPDGLLPAPVLRIRDLAGGEGKELRYVWKTALGERDVKPGDDTKDILDVSHAVLTLDARTVRSKDAVDKATVEGRLTNFGLQFADMARVDIADLKFRTGPGKKPDVAAAGLELTFRNELEFINSLRSALPADSFGGGAHIDVQPSGIHAGYRLALPAIGIGVFSLSNVSLGAELVIPFDGAPVSFRFSVSERTHPFNVSVSLFGGGGYFSMLVDATGVQQIEGAIEFGGSAALNLGVASGGVSVMAGIRFEFDGPADSVSLSGYLRCNGFLCVLGIITVSVEFYLELTYEKHGHESVVRGKGTLTVSVRIAFFSKSVSLELERSFSGAPGDPAFTDCVLPRHWHEYCPAFAP